MLGLVLVLAQEVALQPPVTWHSALAKEDVLLLRNLRNLKNPLYHIRLGRLLLQGMMNTHKVAFLTSMPSVSPKSAKLLIYLKMIMIMMKAHLHQYRA
jgi:hypothetical protein